MVIKIHDQLPQELLTIKEQSEAVRRQKWQVLARKVLEATDDVSCEKAYAESSELIRFSSPSCVSASFAIPRCTLQEEGETLPAADPVPEVELPADLQNMPPSNQDAINEDAFQRHVISAFDTKSGALYITTRGLYYVVEESGCTLFMAHSNLMLHAVPDAPHGTSSFLCHFSLLSVLDAQDNELAPQMLDREKIEQGSADMDLLPYFEVIFSFSSHHYPALLDELYNAMCDANMLAGFTPSMASRMFDASNACCGNASIRCCKGGANDMQACCMNAEDGDCCQQSSRGCCASTSDDEGECCGQDREESECCGGNRPTQRSMPAHEHGGCCSH